MLCASLGGMGQHRDNRFCADKGLKALCTGVCNRCKLFSGRILIQATICKQERTVLAVFTVGYIQNKETGYQLYTGCGL